MSFENNNIYAIELTRYLVLYTFFLFHIFFVELYLLNMNIKIQNLCMYKLTFI